MSIYFGLIALLVLGLLVYRSRALKRFDSDPAQHHLSSLLVGLAARRRDVCEADLSAHLDRVSTSPYNRRARIVHAVLLARASAPPALYARVVELSRSLR